MYGAFCARYVFMHIAIERVVHVVLFLKEEDKAQVPQHRGTLKRLVSFWFKQPKKGPLLNPTQDVYGIESVKSQQ